MAINIDNVGRIMEDYANEAYSYKEAFKILKRTQLDVDNLRSIVKNYKVVPKSITDHHVIIQFAKCLLFVYKLLKFQLLCFLFEGYNLDNAANRVKLYYEIKLNNPHLFKVRDPESPEVQQCLRSQNYFYMSATPEKKSVLYVSLIDYRASSWCFDNFVKTFIMLCESCLISQGPQKGLIFVIDMKGASLAHLSKPNIKTVITIIKFAFYASPILISAVHILNTPSFFHIIMKIFLRPFISREFEKLVS